MVAGCLSEVDRVVAAQRELVTGSHKLRGAGTGGPDHEPGESHDTFRCASALLTFFSHPKPSQSTAAQVFH